MTFKDAMRRLGRRLNPKAYTEYIVPGLGPGFRFFFLMMGLCLLFSLALLVPKLLALGEFVDSNLSAFNTLSLDVNISMNRPIMFWGGRIVLDATGNRTEPHDELIFINSDRIYYRELGLGQRSEIAMDDLKDVKNLGQTLTLFAYTLVIGLCPFLLAGAFIVLSIKWLGFIILVSLAIYFLARFTSFHAPLRKTIIYCLNASYFLAVHHIVSSFVGTYKIFLLLFVLFILLAVIWSGDFRITRKKDFGGKKGDERHVRSRKADANSLGDLPGTG